MLGRPEATSDTQGRSPPEPGSGPVCSRTSTAAHPAGTSIAAIGWRTAPVAVAASPPDGGGGGSSLHEARRPSRPSPASSPSPRTCKVPVVAHGDGDRGVSTTTPASGALLGMPPVSHRDGAIGPVTDPLELADPARGRRNPCRIQDPPLLLKPRSFEVSVAEWTDTSGGTCHVGPAAPKIESSAACSAWLSSSESSSSASSPPLNGDASSPSPENRPDSHPSDAPLPSPTAPPEQSAPVSPAPAHNARTKDSLACTALSLPVCSMTSAVCIPGPRM
mmetsp:Transcript_52450/g.137322  ORF Transcript_52450/g.137322 Transcript_52450/m.137322 type:complete len:277 (-) Transcript_52450:2967-3797(-)